VAIIPLTKNQFAIVDQDDFELLNQLKWYASKGGHGGSFYAMRSFWIEKQMKLGECNEQNIRVM